MPELLLTRNKDFVYDDTDNPFRPEGELAKEADEFVHQLKVKAEQEVADIINTKTSTSDVRVEAPAEQETTIDAKVTAQSPAKSERTKLLSSDNAVNVVVVNEQNQQPDSPTKPAAAAAADTTPTQQAASSNGTDKPKKQKTKSKCGCSIS